MQQITDGSGIVQYVFFVDNNINGTKQTSTTNSGTLAITPGNYVGCCVAIDKAGNTSQTSHKNDARTKLWYYDIYPVVSGYVRVQKDSPGYAAPAMKWSDGRYIATKEPTLDQSTGCFTFVGDTRIGSLGLGHEGYRYIPDIEGTYDSETGDWIGPTIDDTSPWSFTSGSYTVENFNVWKLIITYPDEYDDWSPYRSGICMARGFSGCYKSQLGQILSCTSSGAYTSGSNIGSRMGNTT